MTPTNNPPSFCGLLDRIVMRVQQNSCAHKFAIEDLHKVGTDDSINNRVEWSCDKCGKVFHAHCGVDIGHSGNIFRRSNT